MEITLQNISLPLEQALVTRASSEGKSVDRVAIEVLESGLGVPVSKLDSDQSRDLSFMWEDGALEPEVVQALEGQRVNELPSDASGKVTPKKYRDLSDIAGTWVEDPEFDAILAEQRRIDPELWK